MPPALSSSRRAAAPTTAGRAAILRSPPRRPSVCASASAAAADDAQIAPPATPTPTPTTTRRGALRLLASASSSAAALVCLLSPAAPARANPLEDATRAVLRPADALSDEQAVAALLDARATLRDLAELAATPADSQERFEGRRLWPAFARWLRPAGPAAPQVVALALGKDSAEATLSARYGGAAAAGGGEAAAAGADGGGGGPGAPLGDELYRSLGAVLTISGRTIREEARQSPERALRAAAAIDSVLERVPAAVKDGAQRLRAAARGAAAK